MGNIVQYSVNIAIEATMMVVLSFLLITCLLQKRRFSTTIVLMLMMGAVILLLVEQIAMWVMMINGVSAMDDYIPLRITYFFDYALAFAVYILFYYYMEAVVKGEYELRGSRYENNKKIGWFFGVYALVCVIVYSFAVFDPNLYHLEIGEGVYTFFSYVTMHVSLLVPEFITLFLLIKHRKMMDKDIKYLLLAILIALSLLSIIDELFGLSISYAILSLFIFGLYLKIDLNKEILIERQEKNLVELQTRIMLSQMQPHFLYNIFSTISGLCEMQNAIEAKDVVDRFADYFRMNLDSLGKDKFIPFEKELEHIKTYLWLEKIRFEDYLNINYEITSTDCMVPALSVQPIVENAVKHGIQTKEDAGTVTIKTHETTTDFVVVVEDDGCGFDMNEVARDGKVHVGIQNVSERLKILCNGVLEIQSEKGKGTKVTIRIPKSGGV